MHISDVAIPKGEISAVSVDTDLPSLVATFRESGFTRLPVFEGTLDMPIGMVHLKDVALQHGFDCDARDFDMKALVRPLIYAPPSMPIGILLQKMQSERMHMALVIDEYGGTDGLVSLEDIIEMVVGNIEDEHDDDAPMITESGDGIYYADARADLDEVRKLVGDDFDISEYEDEADTIGGLLFSELGRVPARGEVVQAVPGFEFQVLDADPRRVRRVRIVRFRQGEKRRRFVEGLADA